MIQNRSFFDLGKIVLRFRQNRVTILDESWSHLSWTKIDGKAVFLHFKSRLRT